jgi:hypothetical protein
MDCKFNWSGEKATKRFADPLLKGLLIFGEDSSVTFHSKKKIFNRQAWAVGFSILELSKYVMQDLFYNQVRPKLNNEAICLMSDTDSLLVMAPGKSPDDVVCKLKDVFDCSNYDPSHRLYDPSRKNVVGLLKNEVSQDVITEFVGLKAKTYAFKTAGNVLESKAKGVKKCYKKKIPFEQFKKCLREIRQFSISQVSIQSKNHQNMLMQSEKIAFSSLDDKRYLMNCAIHSVGYNSWLATLQEKTGRCYFCDNPNLLTC